MKEEWINIKEKNLRCFSLGEGDPPILLIHGEEANSAKDYWQNVFRELAKYKKTIALELPGFGESEDPKEFSTNYYIEVVGRFLDKKDIDEVQLVGASLGGAVSLAVSLMSPDKVRRLLLVNSFGLQKKLSNHFLKYLIFNTPLLNSIFLLKSLYLKGNYDTYLKWMKNELSLKSLNTDLVDKLDLLEPEALICFSSKNDFFPISEIKKNVPKKDNIKLYIFDECKLHPFIEAADKFNALAIYFLKNS